MISIVAWPMVDDSTSRQPSPSPPATSSGGTLIGASANVTVTGLAEKDGKRIPFNEFTAFGARVTAITLLISSAYLVVWLYVGSVAVNVGGAAILAAIALAALFRRRSAADH